jgi:hypothetical protein
VPKPILALLVCKAGRRWPRRAVKPDVGAGQKTWRKKAQNRSKAEALTVYDGGC